MGTFTPFTVMLPFRASWIAARVVLFFSASVMSWATSTGAISRAIVSVPSRPAWARLQFKVAPGTVSTSWYRAP